MNSTDRANEQVSVIIVNYNGAESLNKCIESIRSQSYSPKEIILVDNNSADGSADDAERRFPDIQVLRSSTNLGFAEGNNLGIKNSTGGMVLLANNDIVLHPNAISSLVDSLHDDVGIVGGLIYYPNGEKVWAYGGRFDPVTGMHWHLFQEADRRFSFPEKVEVDYVPGAMLLTRRSLLERAGLLDSYFFLYGDDIDLSLKAKRLGYSAIVTSWAKATHMVSQSVRKLEEKHELLGYYLMNRNMFYLYFAQLPLPLALTSTCSQIGFLFIEAFLFRRPFSYMRAKIRAIGQALTHSKKAWLTRRKVGELGKLSVQPRLMDLFKTARQRATSRKYYW